VTRVPAGHPEGYLEGFATIYSDAAELIWARIEGREAEAGADLPTVADGVAGVAFIEAVVESSRRDGAWVSTQPAEPAMAASVGSRRSRHQETGD
jgi:hypothetical protein